MILSDLQEKAMSLNYYFLNIFYCYDFSSYTFGLLPFYKWIK